MNIAGIILIAVGLAMDAFAVSVTDGMCLPKIRPAYALKTSSSFGFFQALMPVIGWLAGIGFSKKISIFDHWIAFILLSFIGIKMIVETIRDKKNPESCPTNSEMDFKRLMALSIATSIDALAVGVTFSVTGVNTVKMILIDVLIIGAITFVICFIGTYIGNKSGSFLKSKAEILGGIILISIGAKILIEHLIEHK